MTPDHNNQLELPLDYSKRVNEGVFAQLANFTQKKKLLNLSAWWHHSRMDRVYSMINKLDERPYSPINESRAERLRKLASVMIHRMELEHKWHYAFKYELYEVM
jgi:hypothetical protein